MDKRKETEQELWDRAYSQAEAGDPELLFRLQDEEMAGDVFTIIIMIISFALIFVLYKFITRYI